MRKCLIYDDNEIVEGNLDTTNNLIAYGKTSISSPCGFAVGGHLNVSSTVVGDNQRYDMITNYQTTRATDIIRRGAHGFDLFGLGFICGGWATSHLSTVRRYDNDADTYTARAGMIAREQGASCSSSDYGYTIAGFSGSNVGTTQRFDDVNNTWTARASATAKRTCSGFYLNNYAFSNGGFTSVIIGLVERFDDINNSHSSRTAITARYGPATYSMLGYGYTSCGYTGTFVGTTQRYDDETNTQTTRASASAREGCVGYTLNNFGFSIAGDVGMYSVVGTSERFDDSSNTHTAIQSVIPRRIPAGFNIPCYVITYDLQEITYKSKERNDLYIQLVHNEKVVRRFEYGFYATGVGSNWVGLRTTERLDDYVNTWVYRASTTTAAGTSCRTNNYGYVFGGDSGYRAAERLDDVANTYTSRTYLNNTRRPTANPSDYYNYSFTIAGLILETSTMTNHTERFDDITNSHTNRTNLPISTANNHGYFLDGYAFSNGGLVAHAPPYTGIPHVYRFDDTANSYTRRADIVKRASPGTYSMLGYGYVSGGYDSVSPYYLSINQRYDNSTDTHTTRASISPREAPRGFSLCGFGYICGGKAQASPEGANTRIVQRFDDTANTHTTIGLLNEVRAWGDGFGL